MSQLEICLQGKLKGINIATCIKASIIGVALATSPVIFAGNNDGDLRGKLISTSSNISNIDLTITNINTGLSRKYKTDTNGAYHFNSLPIGIYKIKVVENGDIITEKSISITIGDTLVYNLPISSGTLPFNSSRASAINQSPITSGIFLDAEELERLPVGRDLTSIALLAPGTVRGDSAFGNLASFSGSNIGENAFYINGLNINNPRNGVGLSSVPYEFFEQFEIKTGGLSAEFGYSTGGIINAVAKSGSNDFKWGINAYFSPDSLKGASSNVIKHNGNVGIWNSDNAEEQLDFNLHASGALIKDQLFYYVLFNPRKYSSGTLFAQNKEYFEKSSDDAFYAAKIDWYFSDNHIFELTTFSDEQTSEVAISNYDFGDLNDGLGKQDRTGEYLIDSGGHNLSLKYTAILSDDISISTLWGTNEQANSIYTQNDINCTTIVDSRQPVSISLPGCWISPYYKYKENLDERESIRLDVEWYLNNQHSIRFGIDREKLTSTSNTQPGDGVYYRYYDATPGSTLPNKGLVPPNVNEIVKVQKFLDGGVFESITQGFYFEELWNYSDSLSLTLGLRNENFHNKNSAGETFVKQSNLWEPRISATWDIFSDGRSKLYTNLGRYHLPVATNASIRLSRESKQTVRYFEIESIDETTSIPTLGNEIGSVTILSPSSLSLKEVIDSKLKATYQDEYIIGYKHQLNENWIGDISFIRRDLKNAAEDVIINYSYQNPTNGPSTQYVLTNPGSSLTTYVDVLGDGVLKQVTFSADELKLPEAQRYYNAINVNLDSTFNDVWQLHGSYTWSQSYGNYEGYVNSNNGQRDANTTTLFDFPELTDGAYGRLPNDRTHSVKIWGNYTITENLIFGAKLTATSGRPISRFGAAHPNVEGDVPYGQTYYTSPEYQPDPSLTEGVTDPDEAQAIIFTDMLAYFADVKNYEKTTQGTFDRTEFITSLDLSLSYKMEFGRNNAIVKLDIFNLFNSQNTTEIDEIAQHPGNIDNADFLLPTSFQTPRSVRFSFALKF